MYYFIRQNGRTLHDNPKNKDCYVAKEPINYKRAGYSNYLDYCFEHNIIRIGWPDVGDIRKRNKHGALANCYDWNTTEIIKPHIHKYLIKYSQIPLNSIVLAPNKDNPGEIFIGEVIKTYWYDPSDLYECAHRIGVKWYRDRNNRPIKYWNDKLGITKRGGWWLKAFYEVINPQIITKINIARSPVQMP